MSTLMVTANEQQLFRLRILFAPLLRTGTRKLVTSEDWESPPINLAEILHNRCLADQEILHILMKPECTVLKGSNQTLL
jgi:hypothetical protein